jgi:hypothetical protein
MKKWRTEKGKKHAKVEMEKIREWWMLATHVAMNGGWASRWRCVRGKRPKKKGEIAHPHRIQRSTSFLKPNPKVTKNAATTRVDSIYIIANKIL